MTNLGKYLIALALVLGAFGTLAFVGLTPFGQKVEQKFGDVVPNAQWFTSGYGFGTNNALYLSGKLTIGVGQNQVAWQNLTGKTVTVDVTHFDLNGIASSTVAVWIGTSTTATVVNVYNTTTAPFWAQLIGSSNTISTSTNGTLYPTQLDNFTNNKSGYPSEIQVLNNQYLVEVVSSACTGQAGISCEVATSTNRGWNAVTPFTYHYDGLN